LRKALVRLGAVIGALLVVIVLLISLGPKVAPYETYYVRSGSMKPTFNTGDLIVLGKTDASDIHKGDIITFERPDQRGSLVTHRVVAVETTPDGRQFETKGDANNAPDAWRVPATGNVWRYKFRIAKVGYVFGYLSTRAARLALLAVPAVVLAVLWLVEIWKPETSAANSVSRSKRGRAAR
jgi:signal peptidase